MSSHRGGAKWKQGVDGCIFLPSLACVGDETPNEPNTVSKVVPKGSYDEIAENFLQTHFPNLVAGKGVLIAQKRCTPVFKTSNIVMSQELQHILMRKMLRMPKNQQKMRGPCVKLAHTTPELYTNFVMEQYDKTFTQYMNTNSLKDYFKVLRNALNAAVGLTPDTEGSAWVLGIDFHTSNILIRFEETMSSLADWGRVILISNHSDLKAFQKGLQEALEYFHTKGYVKTPTEDAEVFYFRSWFSEKDMTTGKRIAMDYPNFPLFVREALDKILFAEEGDDISKEINIARLTNVVSILNSMKTPYETAFQHKRDAFKANSSHLSDWQTRVEAEIQKDPKHSILEKLKSILEDIMTNTPSSQGELANLINKHLDKELTGFEKYIDVEMLFPPVASSSSSSSSASSGPRAAGSGAEPSIGGRRKTRKNQKRKRNTKKKRSLSS